jgi:hypothetical protein
MDSEKTLRQLCEEYRRIQKEILRKTELLITTLVANQYDAGVIEEAMNLRRLILSKQENKVGVEIKSRTLRASQKKGGPG